MKTTIAIAIVALILVVYIMAYIRKREQKSAFLNNANLQLYDYPYYYPHFVRPARWDSDRRCSSYCSSSECATWCR